MVVLRTVPDSDINGKIVYNMHPSAVSPLPTTVAVAATPDGDRVIKKRKRIENLLISSATAALNLISDDSDTSSDEEKSPQELPSGGLKQSRLRLGTKKRRKPHEGRRVIFGDTTSTTRYYAANLTKAELKDLKRDLWFTKQDRLRSQAECSEVIKAFRVQNAEEVTQFSDVYRTTMQVPFSRESSDFLEKATVSVPLTIRGMEWGIAPKLKKRRKEHIQSVLDLQSNIRDVELRNRFLSSRSLQSSRPARIIARMIGEGDASASKFGTTSTALNVTTVPMVKMSTTETTSSRRKLPFGEKRQQNLLGTKKESSSAATNDNVVSCGVGTKPKKMGHARRKRLPTLWRKVT